MDERKSLYDISWQVSEDEYRADPALSYSTLSRYEREGFNNLSRLFDKIESPSLTFGSCVDSLITGSDEEFNERFLVAELNNNLSDTLILITKRLFDTWNKGYKDIRDLSDDLLINTIQDIPWNNHWLPKTRAKKIKEDCAGYYKLLYLSEGKTIISTYTYNDILNTVDKLKSSYVTRFYFEQNNVFDNSIERFYQLKFKAVFDGIEYRCMADLLLVLHDKKLIIPVDLKTSSKPEWDFYKSFIDWRYDLQARLYWLIIRQNLDEDPYFKDFKLADYRFIVANKRTLVPLVWLFNRTTALGDITTKDGLVLRHPLVIGKELRYYLDNVPMVPNGIDMIKPNIIDDWIC